MKVLSEVESRESITFVRDKDVRFTVFIDEEGFLRVTAECRGGRRMVVRPSADNAVLLDAERVTGAGFRAFLESVPDVPPAPGDELPGT